MSTWRVDQPDHEPRFFQTAAVAYAVADAINAGLKITQPKAVAWFDSESGSGPQACEVCACGTSRGSVGGNYTAVIQGEIDRSNRGAA